MRRVHWYLAAVVATVMLVVALRTCRPPQTRSAVDEGAAGPTTTAVERPSGVGPASVVHGVPQGWSHDHDGARTAAVSAVRLTGEIARAGFITRSDMIRSLASERFAPTLAVQSAGQLDEMASDLTTAGVPAGSVTFTELPLTARVAAVEDDAATVKVWTVTVISIGDVAAPRQVWRTVTVELVWEHDDWRVDGWTATPGPTPALAGNASIASADEVADATAWPPVGVG